MVFYAYVINSVTDDSWRYFISFSSPAIADEWWRAVSSDATYSNSVKRINPQFYTHNVSQANASASLTSPVASRFVGKMFFTRVYNKGDYLTSIVPPLGRTDNVSGNSFFIRSKVSPEEYWYCPASSSGKVESGAGVYASRTERTRFFVTLYNEQKDGIVMIGSDDIAITLTSSRLYVKSDDTSGKLFVSAARESMKFSDLLDSFNAGPTFRLKNGQNEHVDEVKQLFMTGDGGEWELA